MQRTTHHVRLDHCFKRYPNNGLVNKYLTGQNYRSVSDSPTRATDAYWGFANEMELGSGPYAIHYDYQYKNTKLNKVSRFWCIAKSKPSPFIFQFFNLNQLFMSLYWDLLIPLLDTHGIRKRKSLQNIKQYVGSTVGVPFFV